MGQIKMKQKGYSGEFDDPDQHKEMMSNIENSYVSQRYNDGLNEHINYMKSLE